MSWFTNVEAWFKTHLAGLGAFGKVVAADLESGFVSAFNTLAPIALPMIEEAAVQALTGQQKFDLVFPKLKAAAIDAGVTASTNTLQRVINDLVATSLPKAAPPAS